MTVVGAYLRFIICNNRYLRTIIDMSIFGTSFEAMGTKAKQETILFVTQFVNLYYVIYSMAGASSCFLLARNLTVRSFSLFLMLHGRDVPLLSQKIIHVNSRLAPNMHAFSLYA